MSGETSLKFLIPGSLCQQSFTVSAVFADRQPEDILICDWLKKYGKYQCNSSPGYTHTLENDHALITVPRDLKEKPEEFTCKLFGQPMTDPSRCLCRITENYIGTSESIQTTTYTNITLGQPGNSSGSNVSLAVCPSVSLLLMVVVVVVVVVDLIGKYWKPEFKQKLIEYRADRPSRARNVKFGAYERFRPQTDEPRMNVPLISATDSYEPLTPPSTAPSTLNKETTPASTGTVSPNEETITEESKTLGEKIKSRTEVINK